MSTPITPISTVPAGTRVVHADRRPKDGAIRHRRGMHVRVVLRDGRAYTGHIDGWGKQLIAIRPTDGGECGWKVESHSNFSVDRVETVEEETP